jgi:hypothetical protein
MDGRIERPARSELCCDRVRIRVGAGALAEQTSDRGVAGGPLQRQQQRAAIGCWADDVNPGGLGRGRRPPDRPDFGHRCVSPVFGWCQFSGPISCSPRWRLPLPVSGLEEKMDGGARARLDDRSLLLCGQPLD